MAATLTPEQVPGQLRQIKDKAPKSMGSAFRRGIARIRASAVKNIRSKGIGKSLWGATDKIGAKKGRKAVAKLVVGGKVQERYGAYSVDLTLKGFPAMMEVGGQTAPHRIEPKNVPLLAFVAAGDLVFAKGVDHPGGPVRKDPSLAPAIDRWSPSINTDIERASKAAIASIIGE